MRCLYDKQRPLFAAWPNHRLSDELKEISNIIDDLPEIRRWVYTDLVGCPYKRKEIGAKGMSADQVLKAAILKQQNGWSYEFLALQCVDSAMTKAFLRLNEGVKFSSSCLQENISKIKSETWIAINDHIVQYAADKKLERGRTIRLDSTVIDANIQPPTDSSLLYDCIRVAKAILKKLRRKSGKQWYSGVSIKEAKSLVIKIISSKTGTDRRRHYRKLLRLSSALLRDLRKIAPKLENFPTLKRAKVETLQKILELLPRIIDQTRRRVLRGESVPAYEKIVSIHESHADVIVKGRRETQFGHKVFLTSGKSGLVLDCDIARGNPADSSKFGDILNRQQEIYGRVPRQTSADGGFASQANLKKAKDMGVTDVCFSKRCGLRIEEMVKSPWVFQKLRNFRAGIEATISVLKRAFGLSRALWRGLSGFHTYVRSTLVSYNLTVIARMKIKKIAV